MEKSKFRILVVISLVFLFSILLYFIMKEDIKKPYNNSIYRKGASNPLVVLEEYSDFFCPHCASVQPIVDSILEDYKGKVALEYHHYSFMGSIKVHEANECAGEQGKFWDFHESAFLNQADLRNGGYESILKVAQQNNLDINSFESCMDDDRYYDKINKSMDYAREKYDIKATPTFVINGKVVEPVEGQGYYEILVDIIDKILSKPLA